MKIYVDEKQRYEDTKSTAWSFTLVSIMGIVLLILLWLNVLPVYIESANKIMISVIMGILFLIFLIIGIKSFLSLKTIQATAEKQDKTSEEVISWFIEEYKDQMLVQFDTDDEEDEEEIFFARNQFITDTISEKYDTLTEEEIDHLAETIYNEIYNEK